MSNNTVTPAQINAILDDSVVEVQTVLGKCTVVTCQLPNGFIIVESSACVDPANYDEKLGAEICLKRIENKIWELEGYKLQSELSENPKLRVGVDITSLDVYKEILSVVQECIMDDRIPKEVRENIVNRLGTVIGELQKKNPRCFY